VTLKSGLEITQIIQLVVGTIEKLDAVSYSPCSVISVEYRNVVDGQTDGQTELLYQCRALVC